MKLKVTSFADIGVLAKERIVLRASANLDVGGYILFKSSVGSSDKRNPTAGRKAAYWFPDTSINANDLVILYSKAGTRSSKLLESGANAYFFYWGKEEPQWTDAKSGAVIAEISDWDFSIPREKE